MICLSKIKELGLILIEVNTLPLPCYQFVISARVKKVNSISQPLFDLRTDNSENKCNKITVQNNFGQYFLETRCILPATFSNACEILMSVTFDLKMLDLNFYINDGSSNGHFQHAQHKSISSAQCNSPKMINFLDSWNVELKLKVCC